MNLAWHQFRKDVRQFRLHLAIWSALLLLDLAVNLDWVGRVVYSSPRGFDRAANTWTDLLPGVLWALVGLLPSLVVLADSPARRDGFLATRPLPKWGLFLSKLLFVLALVVAPWTAQEWIHLVAAGAPAWVVERGTLERLLFALPVALSCAGFAALWPGPARWARAVGIVFGCFVLFSATTSLLTNYFHWTSLETGPVKSKGLFNGYAVTLGLMLLAVWHARAPRGFKGRWGGLLLAAIVPNALASALPWDVFQLQPANPALAQSTVAQAGFEIPPRDIRLNKEQASEEAEHQHFGVNVEVRTAPPPARQTVEWSGKDAKLSRVSGGVIPGSQNIYYSELFRGGPWNQSYAENDYTAWAASLPAEVLFHKSYTATSDSPDWCYLGSFNLPTNRQEWSDPLDLQARLKANVFQWRKIADLPLQPGATSTDEFGSWKYLATQMDAGVKALGSLYFERRQISLSTAADSRCSSENYGPLARMAFVVYDPKNNVAWMPDSTSYDQTDRGAQTALARYYAVLTFYSSDESSRPLEGKDYRLLVFEKSWLGSVPEAWHAAPFTLEEKLSPQRAFAINTDPMPEAEFRRRIAGLGVPAPDAPRREVARYLFEVLRTVDARGARLSTNDPLQTQLAALVPRHLDLLLDGLPALAGSAYFLVRNAITQGATEAQKPAIIAALPEDPGLADVLLARGWMDDARAELNQLAQSPRALPFAALRAIAWLKDPQTYPRLLEEFERDPSVEKDDLLRDFPGMAPPLEAVVARQWRSAGLAWKYPDEDIFAVPFVLAMRHGDPSALRRVYQVLGDRDFDHLNSGTALGPSLAQTVEMPGLKAEDRRVNSRVLAWMRRHRPEDFVFDAARRKFVPKPGP